MWAQLKALDVYPKIHEDMKVRTFSGAMVSIISGLLITYLFFSELALYLTVETVDRLSVDVSRGEKLQINFDVTFPHLPCSLLSVDAMDVSGSHQLDVSHHIRKQVLDSFGVPAGAEQLHQLTGGKDKDKEKDANAKPREPPKPDPTKQPGYCGSCYGAEDVKGQCCNTCEAVRAAYRTKGWAMTSLSHIEQCVASGETVENYKAELERGDGCRMYGHLEVNKVAGNFHFAPGKSFQHNHMHVHDMASIPAAAFNVSHVINRLSFGQDFPGVVNPLDRTEKHVVGEAAGMVMYYVKVVPTTYAPLSSPPISTNQFSVTEHFRHTEPQKGAAAGGGGGSGGLPGVFFFYELSPIMVAFTEQRQSLGHFLVQLCAILGGVFTVAGFVDRIVFSGLRHLEKKMSINKLT